ncbi:acetylornithine aminotransferase ArgD [Thermoclostridium stercorarium subsp. stercorarium DSM 8532]|jgi:acetylornithine/N-succinyldiaminopimelate aminotransferase|uniref:Acetylornithine aminotransferase n=2 Tax=Thermoclostridium stercorarium TaxID=1510 RepID=L7VMG8_THES1|nr:acetylornithine transaminase [Thermoclostridium stercorarium]AGC69420.1 acetylornithine aminotransferase ArgD [Thermoclostridium stercorarium subsp. stercorarium DSM 8532]AGI40378.1 acetylornithine aminotransferase [Thermoclostridium stercorarium subsp. stercorarium DSM 8532]ANW99669.1 acetylornithine aminotransferase [Thermoclostridium stercorarium subsp. thermolacticum DSM 2910]UZQ85373.1 acetylornithine transaminase [Thermoclostridium stercorarium]
MELDEIIQKDKKYYMNTFGNRIPVCFTHGKGIYLYDNDGNEYRDFFAGIAVCALGHSHPALVNAICDQAKKLIHCSNLYYIEQQARLAELIVENSCADRVFFANSGAEANEGAIKLARLYFRKKGMPDKYEIVTLYNSFHGRTLATLAATGQEKYQKPFAPLTPKFSHVPINDVQALEKAINENTCAVMLEPVQGEGGVHPATAEYMNAVRKICDEKGILLIFDEVQCGLGRTGKLFAYQHYGVEPDIFTLAKALAGGFPIGALCAKEHVASAFEPGEHGSTFGGNPLACSAGLAVLSTIINEKLSDNAAEVGNYFFEKMDSLKNKFPIISEVRGKGLMIGIEFAKPVAKQVNMKLFERRYLLGTSGENVLRILPPLIVTKEDMDGLINVLAEVLQDIN